MINLHRSSCFDFLPKLEPLSVDLCLTDPPYAISKETGFKSVKNGVKRFAVSMDFGMWDKAFEGLAESIFHIYNSLKIGGTCIIFYDLWKITPLKKMMEDAGFKQIRMIEWIKKTRFPLTAP